MCHEAIQSLYVPLKTIPNNLKHFFCRFEKSMSRGQISKKAILMNYELFPQLVFILHILEVIKISL